MSKHAKIPASDEAWERGQLGDSEEHVKKLEEDIEAQIDAALELHPISIRLQKSLIDDLKMISALSGIGYQPLMRQVLKRFVDCEKKKILQEKYEEARRMRALQEQEEPDDRKPALRKTA